MSSRGSSKAATKAGTAAASVAKIPPMSNFHKWNPATWTPQARVAKTASTTPNGKALTAALKAAETKIGPLKYEQGWILRPNGEVVLRRRGGSRACSWSASEYRAMRDMILTHNHPGGLPFSTADVVFASRHELREIRAIGDNGYLYTARAPRGKTWDATSALAIQPSFDRALARLTPFVRREIASGQLPRYYGNLELYHRVWMQVAKDTGIQYKRYNSFTGKLVMGVPAPGRLRPPSAQPTQPSAPAPAAGTITS